MHPGKDDRGRDASAPKSECPGSGRKMALLL